MLHRPGPLADHGDQLPPRIHPAPGRRQQLRRPRPGGHIERHQRPVPVRAQRREDRVELLIRDVPRDPGRHHRPVQTAALVAVGLHRVVMRVRPSSPSRPVQRERVDQRARARLHMKVIKTAQHRLAMRAHRRRIRLARGRPEHLRPRAPLPPMRADRLSGHHQPAAELPGLGPGRLVPGHPGRPHEPEPAQQIQAIRPDRQLRPPRRLQMPEIGPRRLHSNATAIQQPVRLPPIPGSYQLARQRHHQASQVNSRLLPIDHDRRPYPPTQLHVL